MNSKAPHIGIPRTVSPAATMMITSTMTTSGVDRGPWEGPPPGASGKSNESMFVPTCRCVTPRARHGIWLHRELLTATSRSARQPLDLLTSDPTITIRGPLGWAIDSQTSACSPPEDGEQADEQNAYEPGNASRGNGTGGFIHFRPGGIAEAGHRVPRSSSTLPPAPVPRFPWRRGCTMKQGPGITVFQRGAHEGGASSPDATTLHTLRRDFPEQASAHGIRHIVCSRCAPRLRPPPARWEQESGLLPSACQAGSNFGQRPWSSLFGGQPCG